jgi:predicted Zn-dependent peptidase
LTYQELLLGEIKDIEDELTMVDAVTAADIRRVANSVLRSPMQLAVIGPFTRESIFRSAIDA